jgi:hypothetical protein
MVLIINELHCKTHETTGKKPAKPEMNNKPNMTRNNHIHMHPFNPYPENQINQMNQWPHTNLQPENTIIPEK